MRLRYAGACRFCGADLAAGVPAIYERPGKTVRCIECPSEGATQAEKADDQVEVDAPAARGTAGASARRECERRNTGREQRIRAKHPKVGGLILAVSDEPQTTSAWATGALGEERLGGRLDSMTGPSARVLHDRRISGTRANIDHIMVCPGGVFVIDAKRYKGRPHLRVEGGIIRQRSEKLLVGSRDCTKLVDGMLKQVALVRAAIGDDSAAPVRGFLCFVNADWPLFGGSFTTRKVSVVWPKKLASIVSEPGTLSETDIAATHHRLAAAFPIA